MLNTFRKSSVLSVAAVALCFVPAMVLATEIVEIVEPEDGDNLIVITEGGTTPGTLPILVEVETNGFVDGVAGVEVALDGVINGNTWTGTSIVDANVKVSDPNEWDAVVDLTEADGLTRADTFTQITIRAFATAAQYYNNSRATATFDAQDSISFGVDIIALEDVDTDGNGMPDADELTNLSPPGSDTPVMIIITNADGTETITTFESIAEVPERGSDALGAELSIVLDLGNGQSVTALINSPTLAELQGAIPGNTSLQNATNGILVVAVNTNPANLVDNAVDPLSEFNIPDAAAPSGAFLRVHILLEVPGVRGGVSGVWVELTDTLPAGFEVALEVFGSALTGITDGFLYSYDTTYMQSGNDLTYAGDEAGWVAVSGAAVNADGDGWEILLSEIGQIFGAYAEGLDSSSSGGTCLIATAAYGTPMAQELNTIRSLRNTYLLNNAAGQFVSNVYYRLSPGMVQVVESHPVLMNAAQIVLVPFIAVCGVILNAPVAMMLTLAATAMMAVGIRRRKSVRVQP